MYGRGFEAMGWLALVGIGALLAMPGFVVGSIAALLVFISPYHVSWSWAWPWLGAAISAACLSAYMWLEK